MAQFFKHFIAACIFFTVLIFADAVGQQLTGVSIIGARLYSQGSGDVVGPTSSSDGGLVVFNLTTGKAIKQFVGSGVIKVSAGVASVVTGTSSDCVKVDGTSGACGGGGGGSYSAGDGISSASLSGGTIAVDTSVPSIAAEGSQSLTFSSIASSSCGTQTITASGAQIGDKVTAGWPATLPDGLAAYMRVTNTNEITVTLCKVSSGSATVTGLSFGYQIIRSR